MVIPWKPVINKLKFDLTELSLSIVDSRTKEKQNEIQLEIIQCHFSWIRQVKKNHESGWYLFYSDRIIRWYPFMDVLWVFVFDVLSLHVGVHSILCSINECKVCYWCNQSWSSKYDSGPRRVLKLPHWPSFLNTAKISYFKLTDRYWIPYWWRLYFYCTSLCRICIR